MAASIKWTKAALEKLPAHVKGAKSSNYEVTDPSTAGLKLQIGVTGRKFFWFRYTYRGEKCSVRIGEFGPLSIDQARAKAMEHRATLDLGGNPQELRLQLKAMPLVSEFVEDYMAQAKLTKITYKNDQAKFRDYILPAIGHLRLGDVTQKDIQLLLGSQKDKLANSTINRIHALLSVFFNLAVSYKKIKESPCANMKKLKEANKKERFLTSDQVREILAMAQLDMNRVAANAISALILTGLRREEILRSRHEHLDLEKKSLFLPKTKSGKSRHVALNDAALQIFKSTPRIDGSPWIFPGKDPMKPLNNPTKAWHRILAAAGVERCRLHDCRHTFASLLVNAGATLYQVQLLLGHASNATTQRYAHLSTSTLRDTSQMVANLVS
ncbi:site-specific integrase [Rugamonas apoptosis]|uniref:Tyrosine-type recombinase/integrase n=1 Tax=Rugamonas apoptosis TaxID=2758570 RepID=A0A7W2F6C8_9BURK|nr:site-specific integrase [Rugamonas apoptosis]MBA5685927.1 tyrosine-type recombinase/integrase [Rugamonas apoptosis]